jgi:hypothetical protein
VFSILDKVSSDIFVLEKEHVLQKTYLEFEVWSLIQIQSLAEVWVMLRFEFWVATS